MVSFNLIVAYPCHHKHTISKQLASDSDYYYYLKLRLERGFLPTTNQFEEHKQNTNAEILHVK